MNEPKLKFWDVSPVISPALAVWPGDVPFTYTETLRLEDGASVTLGAISGTLHLGAHVDAPSHFRTGAPAIDAVDLRPYFGPCQVIAASAARGARVRPEDIEEAITQRRLLVKTSSYADPGRFTKDFCSLSVELIALCASNNVLLIGIDTPSIDPFESKDLEAHHALLDAGIRNLEGLTLAQVEPGVYHLCALPLRIAGADGSPVRAVLFRTDQDRGA